MRISIYVCVLLCLAFMLHAQQDEVIFYEDFEDVAVGEVPKDWQLTNVGKLEVVEFPSADDKSLFLVDEGSGAGAKLYFEAQEGGVFSVEYKFYKEECAGSAVEIIYVVGSKGDQPFNGCCVAIQPGGGFDYNDGGAWQGGRPIEDKVWHTFKYVIDMDGEGWDLFYDDEKVKSNIKFRGNTGKALDTLLIMNFVNGGTTFKAYFSEIIIYEGTERPLSVDKKGKLATLWSTIRTTPQWVAPHHGIRDF